MCRACRGFLSDPSRLVKARAFVNDKMHLVDGKLSGRNRAVIKTAFDSFRLDSMLTFTAQVETLILLFLAFTNIVNGGRSGWIATVCRVINRRTGRRAEQLHRYLLLKCSSVRRDDGCRNGR